MDESASCNAMSMIAKFVAASCATTVLYYLAFIDVHTNVEINIIEKLVVEDYRMSFEHMTTIYWISALDRRCENKR
jgi:hypothetical protein